MNVTFTNFRPDFDPAMAQAVMQRIERFYGDEVEHDLTATVHMREREKDGWLEWVLVLPYRHGGQITVGAIQREPGGQIEFHS